MKCGIDVARRTATKKKICAPRCYAQRDSISENQTGRLQAARLSRYKKTHPQKQVRFLEVPPGFEPGNNGFADRCLTTWLWYHMERLTGCGSPVETFAAGKSTDRGGSRELEPALNGTFHEKTHPQKQVRFLEVPPGFEPGNNGFADRCLTTWLWYRMERLTGLEPATSTLARWRSTR